MILAIIMFAIAAVWLILSIRSFKQKGFLLDKQIAPGILLILIPINTSIGLYASVRNYKNKQKKCKGWREK